MSKNLVAFQIPEELLQQLQSEAKTKMISLSALIRIIILEHYKKDDKNEIDL